MKKEKIEELWINSKSPLTEPVFMDFEEFTQAINQSELEWYKQLEKKMDRIAYLHYEDIPRETRLYLNEIQNKIKELENEN